MKLDPKEHLLLTIAAYHRTGYHEELVKELWQEFEARFGPPKGEKTRWLYQRLGRLTEDKR